MTPPPSRALGPDKVIQSPKPSAFPPICSKRSRATTPPATPRALHTLNPRWCGRSNSRLNPTDTVPASLSPPPSRFPSGDRTCAAGLPAASARPRVRGLQAGAARIPQRSRHAAPICAQGNAWAGRRRAAAPCAAPRRDRSAEPARLRCAAQGGAGAAGAAGQHGAAEVRG
eukprot:365333-Chlamydomonas_euryale.AAC.27